MLKPPADFVRQLHDEDPTLRVRWAKFTAKWFIEVKCGEQQPSWVKERPSPLGKNARAKDLWQSWQDGYLHVLSVNHHDLKWEIVGPVIRELRLAAHGAADAVNARLDALNEEFDKKSDRMRDNLNDIGISEIYERSCWDQGRRVSFYNPPPVEEHDGFRVVDRRVRI